MEDQHLFFKIELPDPIEGTRKYHIHLNFPGATDYKNALKFRDYLRNHPEDVERYAEVKQRAAEMANEDKHAYMSIKSPVIQEILDKALRN